MSQNLSYMALRRRSHAPYLFQAVIPANELPNDGSIGMRMEIWEAKVHLRPESVSALTSLAMTWSVPVTCLRLVSEGSLHATVVCRMICAMRITLVCLSLLLAACRLAPTESPRPARRSARASVASESAETPRVKALRPRGPRPVARRTTPASRFIPTTRIPATPANQAVVAVVTRYRQALVARSRRALLAVVHPNYHDRAGTPSPHDDIRHADVLRKLVRLLRPIRIEYLQMAVLSLQWRGRQLASVKVDSTLRFRIRNSKGGWGPLHTRASTHLIQMAKYKGKWLITSGL